MLKRKLKVKEAEIERLKEIERYAIQLKSDFEHYRQLSQKEQKRTIEFANAALIEKLVPILTNFERATKHAPSQEATPEIKRVFKGYEMIYQLMRSTLENEGLKIIEATPGVLFDPFEQEAVDKIETEKYPDGTVIEVVERGYKYRDKVVVPVKVKVSVEPKPVEPAQSEDSDIPVGKAGECEKPES
jgi:molecular chaperone GrpE